MRVPFADTYNFHFHPSSPLNLSFAPLLRSSPSLTLARSSRTSIQLISALPSDGLPPLVRPKKPVTSKSLAKGFMKRAMQRSGTLTLDPKDRVAVATRQAGAFAFFFPSSCNPLSISLSTSPFLTCPVRQKINKNQ